VAQPENEIPGLDTAPRGLEARGVVNLTLDIRATPDQMRLYAINRSTLETLRAGNQSDEDTMFGVSIAVFLTIAGILIPLYVTDAAHGLVVAFMWAVLVSAGASTYYFRGKRKALHEARELAFNDILEKSETVVVLTPKNE